MSIQKSIFLVVTAVGLTGLVIFGNSQQLLVTSKAIADEGKPPFACGKDGVTNEDTGQICSLADYIAEPTGFVYQSWRATRTIVNVLLIIALLVISFSNITRFNIDTYTVKKALPNLILGVILANASFLIVRYLADLATVATYLFVNLSLGTGTTFASFLARATGQLAIASLETIGAGTALFAPIILLFGAIVIIILFLWLAFLLYFRLVAVYLLTILAPIAFVAYGIPGMEKYFKMWWQQMVKWLFMLPAMAAVFWMIIAIDNASAGQQSVAKLMIMFVLFFIACTIPSRFGGAVIDRASGFFKKGTGTVYNQSQNLGGDLSLIGRNIASAEGAGTPKKLLGKGLQHTGSAISAPRAMQMALKRRYEGKARAREYAAKQTAAYKYFAGQDAVYQDAMTKQLEDWRGTPASELINELRQDDYNSLRDWYEAIPPEQRRNLHIGSPFSSWQAMEKLKSSLPPGTPLDKVAKFLALIKLFDSESRRRIQPNQGIDAAVNAGWKFNPQGPGGQANPYGDTAAGPPVLAQLDPASLANVRKRLSEGEDVESLGEEIASAIKVDKNELKRELNDLHTQIKLEPLVDHFRAEGTAFSQEIAKLGAETSEQFEEAFVNKGELTLKQALERGQEVIKKAGGFYSPDPSKTIFDQAVDMQAEITKITRAAHAAAAGHSPKIAVEINSSIDSLQRQIASEISVESNPTQQANLISESENVSQAIQNHLTQQVYSQGGNLNSQQISQLSQGIKEELVRELTTNKTLSRIFGSEKFRQKIIDAVSIAKISNDNDKPVIPETFKEGPSATDTEPQISEPPEPPQSASPPSSPTP